MRYSKIIFVSQDDTYRAPVAATILKRKIGNKDIKIESRGLVVHFPEPANPKGVEVAKAHGLNLSRHTARQLTEMDFGVDILVLVMTERGKQKIYDRFVKAVDVYSIKEFVGSTGDVDIPYGKSIEEYEDNFVFIETLINEVIKKIDELNS
ncbi:MAG: protein tyrosine phosphatase [Lachnospiraceae bacterium]|nr:protein tyrosine phosphatase [Lachnospiraceae bacterium]MDE6698458.1 protein tyrosine phosphatase [Lachnospiraceae bacterium]